MKLRRFVCEIPCIVVVMARLWVSRIPDKRWCGDESGECLFANSGWRLRHCRFVRVLTRSVGEHLVFVALCPVRTVPNWFYFICSGIGMSVLLAYTSLLSRMNTGSLLPKETVVVNVMRGIQAAIFKRRANVPRNSSFALSFLAVVVVTSPARFIAGDILLTI